MSALTGEAALRKWPTDQVAQRAPDCGFRASRAHGRPTGTYFDHGLCARIANVAQGQFIVGDGAELVLSTVLGSCVAACIYDPVAKVGGMNHFLLPDGKRDADAAPYEPGMALRYGSHAMELLVNGILQRGGASRRLQVKLFGGAKVVANLSDIGGFNATFAHDFVRSEGYMLVSEDLRGVAARRVQFWPGSGRARVSYLHPDHYPRLGKQDATAANRRPEPTGDIELF